MKDKIKKTKEEWKKQLSPEAYYVTRESETEQAFTGRYNRMGGGLPAGRFLDTKCYHMISFDITERKKNENRNQNG